MNALRALVATAGTVLLAAVGLITFEPGLADAVPVAAAVETLGNDYFFIAVFGAVGLALALATLGGRAVSGLDQATPPRPETVQPAPVFGADFDEALSDGAGPLSIVLSDRREAIRDRLRENAIRAEIADSGCGRSTAERRVEAGEWTDDPDARAFLDPSRSPGVDSRLRAVARGNTWFERGARRTAETVVAKTGGEHR